MAEKTDWYPPTRPAQRVMYANFTAKIDNYKDTLGLSTAQIDRLKLICAVYIAVYDWMVLIEATKTERLVGVTNSKRAMRASRCSRRRLLRF